MPKFRPPPDSPRSNASRLLMYMGIFAFFATLISSPMVVFGADDSAYRGLDGPTVAYCHTQIIGVIALKHVCQSWRLRQCKHRSVDVVSRQIRSHVYHDKVAKHRARSLNQASDYRTRRLTTKGVAQRTMVTQRVWYRVAALSGQRRSPSSRVPMLQDNDVTRRGQSWLRERLSPF